nr:hypothetical protein [Chloroflexota bacterium]
MSITTNMADAKSSRGLIESQDQVMTEKKPWQLLYRQRTSLLSILLLVTGFALGGCVTSWMMRGMVLEMMNIYQDQAQVLAVYNLLDHLIPYYLYFGVALVVCVAVMLFVWLGTRTPKHNM